MESSPNYERGNFDSTFLCSVCGGLIYFENSDPSLDLCLNNDCPSASHLAKFIIEPSQDNTPTYFLELSEEEDSLIAKIKATDYDAFASYVYQIRKELLFTVFSTGVMPSLDTWFVCGELLLLINQHQPNGSNRDTKEFEDIFKATALWHGHHCNLEDLLTKRYIVIDQPKGPVLFQMKYAAAHRNFLTSMGLVSEEDVASQSEIFPFEELENEMVPNVALGESSKMEEWLDSFWQLSLQQRYAYSRHYRTSTQYAYQPNAVDISILLGWFAGLLKSDETHYLSSEQVVAELENHYERFAGGLRESSDFLNEFVDSKTLSPILVRTTKGLLGDKLSLAYFLIYLHGCPPGPNPIGADTSVPILQRVRDKLGLKFEGWLRQEIFSLGYSGPDFAVKVSAGGQEYEYDILAISEENQRIIIADAKFQDIAPSSYTGENLLKQEFLGKNALRDESIRQQNRLEFFHRNKELFKGHLNPTAPWGEYDIQSALILKHIPLASRYKATRIIQAQQFLSEIKAS